MLTNIKITNAHFKKYWISALSNHCLGVWWYFERPIKAIKSQQFKIGLRLDALSLINSTWTTVLHDVKHAFNVLEEMCKFHAYGIEICSQCLYQLELVDKKTLVKSHEVVSSVSTPRGRLASFTSSSLIIRREAIKRDPTSYSRVWLSVTDGVLKAKQCKTPSHGSKMVWFLLLGMFNDCTDMLKNLNDGRKDPIPTSDILNWCFWQCKLIWYQMMKYLKAKIPFVCALSIILRNKLRYLPLLCSKSLLRDP